jgi:hypothetical protein
MTTVPSASKIWLSRSLGILIKGGGAGASDLGLDTRLSDFREKMPDDHVWYFRFLDVDSLEDVLGRNVSPAGDKVELGEPNESIGSGRSAVGVVAGEQVSECVYQKCFFFVGGLLILSVPGEPEADSGLLGRLIIDKVLSDAMLGDKVDMASAVCGRSGEAETS